MDAYIAIATKGRAPVVLDLLDWLAEQTHTPTQIVVVGTQPSDVDGVAQHPLCAAGIVDIALASAGLCRQRNAATDRIRANRLGAGHAARFWVAFFDDDFRPHRAWLEECHRVFAGTPGVAGVTGRVVADGIAGAAISDAAARDYVDGRRPAMKHWAGGFEQREVECLYGCNMAYRDDVFEHCRFDENLALYGWQEDQDFSSQAGRHGAIVHVPACSGVHLGVKSGRVSGLRFGYSQIANPWYLTRKGTMTPKKSVRLVSRNLIANVVKSFTRPEVDYPGRLRGNLRAVVDLVAGSCHPARILELEDKPLLRVLRSLLDRKTASLTS